MGYTLKRFLEVAVEEDKIFLYHRNKLGSGSSPFVFEMESIQLRVEIDLK